MTEIFIEFALGTVAAKTSANTSSESCQITYELIEGSGFTLEVFLDTLRDAAQGLRKAVISIEYCSYEDLRYSVHRAAEVLQATVYEKNANRLGSLAVLQGVLM